MAQIAERINPNFEKIGSIKVLSSSGPTSSERVGLVFGGYAYSADIQANEGNGYSITIKVISKNGKYSISSKDLSAIKTGSKNIVIGNFTFFDFYLIEYSVDKEVDSSILTLTYKDKSIFLDKVFIGLFNNDFGRTFDATGNLSIPENTFSEPTFAQFNYKCDDGPNGIKIASLGRFLNRVYTKFAQQTIFKTYFVTQNKTSLPSYLQSDAFYSRFDYKIDGVNGGFIILGREEINEEVCVLPEVTYCFKDLLASLAYSKIPGIEKFNLGDNEAHSLLRRNYFGSLRSVLDSWGRDFGLKFYFQPKIEYSYKDYTDDANNPVKSIEDENLKIINLTSSSISLKKLNQVLNDNTSLNKVIESLAEKASLEGTKKSNLITTIKRNARTFSSNSSYSFSGSSYALGLENIPSLYFQNPGSTDFIISGTLSNYDEDLRDIYNIQKENYGALGIFNFHNIGNDRSITRSLDFLKLFGPGLGENPSETLNDFNIILAVYDEGLHRRIKDWEKAVMSEFYNQYFMINLPKTTGSCNQYNNFSTSYETTPSSEIYSSNELPFSDLLFAQTPLNKNYSNAKYPPIFKAENPFDAKNQQEYEILANSIPEFSSKKTLTIINLKENTKAQISFMSCLNNDAYIKLTNLLQQGSVSIIVSRKLNSVGINNIYLDTSGQNSSVTTLSDLTNKRDVATKCPTLICDESLANTVCGNANNANEVNSIDTGFINRASRRVVIQLFDNTNRYLVLPTSSAYKYAVVKNSDFSTTFSGGAFIFGVPPYYENENVLSCEVAKNDVPESLTQAVSEQGIQSQIVTFDPKTGKNERVVSAQQYHNIVASQVNGSVLEPFESKRISLTSTHVPSQLIEFIFKSPLLNSMQFSLNESGFNTVLDFSSRPKQFKPQDSVFLTQKFLRTL